MPIEIGTTGEIGILFTGISIGVISAMKTIKWIYGIIDTRKAHERKNRCDENPIDYIMKSPNSNVTRAEHDSLCKGVRMDFDAGIKDLREDIRRLSEVRSNEIHLIFKEIKENHTEVRNLFQTQGERIAGLEVKVGKNGK